MKIKVAEAAGPVLDWMVATVLGGLYQSASVREAFWIWPGEPVRYSKAPLNYSTDWAHGGPIIEREEIGIRRNAPCSKGREWQASPSITAKGAGGKWGYGPTPLIAAMRCFVASKLGEEVEVPKELL